MHDKDHDGNVTKWELLEISAVPVPLDPDALAESNRIAAREMAMEVLEATAKMTPRQRREHERSVEFLLALRDEFDEWAIERLTEKRAETVRAHQHRIDATDLQQRIHAAIRNVLLSAFGVAAPARKSSAFDRDLERLVAQMLATDRSLRDMLASKLQK